MRRGELRIIVSRRLELLALTEGRNVSPPLLTVSLASALHVPRPWSRGSLSRHAPARELRSSKRSRSPAQRGASPLHRDLSRAYGGVFSEPATEDVRERRGTDAQRYATHVLEESTKTLWPEVVRFSGEGFLVPYRVPPRIALRGFGGLVSFPLVFVCTLLRPPPPGNGCTTVCHPCPREIHQDPHIPLR